ncbi:MAG: ABC transporter ATP-binding protein [Acidimicrobiia bacterium]
MSAITVRDLVMRYGDLEAVAGIDLTIEEGEVFALLGPNGAGKTTTVEILEGHRRRSSGEVEVLGQDPHNADRDFRERIGIVLQERSVELDLTVREALDIFGGAYPNRRPSEEVIPIVGLEEKADDRVKTLSGGQIRRLELALGIIGDPELIFLDEPTTGFDPSARRQAWTVIDNLRSLGKTILLTTHYMDEAQNLSDRIAVISNGVIVAEGTPETIGGRKEAQTVIEFVAPESPQLPLGLRTGLHGRVRVETSDPTVTLDTLTSWAVQHEIKLVDLTVSRPSLEDVYLELTDGEAEE